MTDPPVEMLERWEAGGAVWRLAARTEHEAVVDLLSCDGERMGQVRSGDPELLAYVDRRTSSEEEGGG